MQLNKPSVPSTPRFDPREVTDAPATRAAKQTLSRLNSVERLNADRRALSQVADTQATHAARKPLYTELSKQLTSLRTGLNELGLTNGAGDAPDARSPLEELKGVALAVNDVATLIEQGASPDDRLLADLGAALNGLFTRSGDGGVRTLGDLGFSRADGELSFDAARFDAIAAAKPAQLDAFLSSYLTDRMAPLLKDGAGALDVAQQIAPAAVENASQAVRVRGEVARMQAKQQLLALEQLSYDTYRERMARQSEAIQAAADTLKRLTPSGLPERVEATADLADHFAVDAPPPPVAVKPSAGVSSFGLGGDGT